jgi:hypothetical protein
MRVTNHPIEPEELMAYLDGELPAERAAVAAFHLEACEECQKAADDFRVVSARLSGWQVEPSTLKAPALLEKPKKASFFGQWRWASVSLVATPLVGLVLLTAIFLPSRDTSPRLFQAQRFGVPVDEIKARNPVGVVVDDTRSMGPMIVRMAQLTVTVKDVDKSRSSLDDLVKRQGGYIGQLTARGRSVEATLRVPAGKLDALMAELKQFGRVESESQNGEEVTQQYTDLEARLSNARNSERRLSQLLSQRTGKLSDVLDVEKEIERVRGEIERMEAEQKGLTNRIDFATVSVKLAEDSHASLRLQNAAVEGYRSLVESMEGAALFLLSNGPTLLFWSAVLFLPVRWLWRRSKGHLPTSA